jgi:peroxiredoxin Q/BCP
MIGLTANAAHSAVDWRSRYHGDSDAKGFRPGGSCMRALMTIGLAAALAVGAKAQSTELKVGDTAPDFSLQASDGKTYRLSDFIGKKAVVVAWFTKAFTLGCSIECKSLTENGHKIRMYDVAYFMVSTDKLEDQAEFAKATRITPGDGPSTVVDKKEADFPLLADPTRDAAKKYGVLMANGQMANRWTFYIDKSGKIALIDKSVTPATSAEDMVNKLAELKVEMAQN